MSRLLDDMSRAERRRRQRALDAERTGEGGGEPPAGSEPLTETRSLAAGSSAVERAAAWAQAEREADATVRDAKAHAASNAYAVEGRPGDASSTLYAPDELLPYGAGDPAPQRRARRGTLALAALAGAVALGAGWWSLTAREAPVSAGAQEHAPPATIDAAQLPPGVYVVEVATLRDAAQAAQLEQKLAHAGLRGHVETVQTETGVAIRVHAGPYLTLELAEAARARLSAAGLSGAVLTR